MGTALEVLSHKPKNGEAVAHAICEHEKTVSDWRFREAAVRLNGLFDKLNKAFFSNVLPKTFVAVGPDLIVRYGYYHLGRDEIGAKHKIQVNARHFGRSESDVAVTLLHEMLHLFQWLHGRPSRRRHRYHNKEFVNLAQRTGLHAELGSGRTIWVSPRLRKQLDAFGFSMDKPMMEGVDDAPVKRPVRNVRWDCPCGRAIWAPAIGDPLTVCIVCGGRFKRNTAKKKACRGSKQVSQQSLSAFDVAAIFPWDSGEKPKSI